jgi:aspartyl/asparaginyl beta-hydroxylase (cupin superfamily)
MNSKLTSDGLPEKLWYAFKGRPYIGNALSFYNSNSFEWALELEENIPVIKKEILKFLEKNECGFVPYFNSELTSDNDSWKTISFKFWGQNLSIYDQVPITKEFLTKVPNLTSVGLSKIGAGKEIRPHSGDSNAIIRCHLPIKIPVGLPDCGIEVKGEKMPWPEGKLVMFCDAQEHSAFNFSNEDRIVLIFDFLRTDFQQKEKRILANVTGELWLQNRKSGNKLISKMPRFFQGFIRYCVVLKLQLFN